MKSAVACSSRPCSDEATRTTRSTRSAEPCSPVSSDQDEPADPGSNGEPLCLTQGRRFVECAVPRWESAKHRAVAEHVHATRQFQAGFRVDRRMVVGQVRQALPVALDSVAERASALAAPAPR